MSGDHDRDLGADLDTIAAWNAAAVLTLTTDAELERLRIAELGSEVRARFMEWHHAPFEDYHVPDGAFEDAWPELSGRLRSLVSAGNRVLVHCRGGLGRAGMVAAGCSSRWAPTRRIEAERLIFETLKAKSPIGIDDLLSVIGGSRKAITVRMKYLAAKLARQGWLVENLTGSRGRGKKSTFRLKAIGGPQTAAVPVATTTVSSTPDGDAEPATEEAPGLDRVNPTILGAAAEHYVMCQLLRRGMIAALAPTGVPDVDLIVSDKLGASLAAVQVKARRGKSGGTNGWRLAQKHETIKQDLLFYCFVDFGEGETAAPRCWIVPSKTVAEVLTIQHKAWLAKPNKKGEAQKPTDMRFLRWRYPWVSDGAYKEGWLDRFEGSWGLISPTLESALAAA